MTIHPEFLAFKKNFDKGKSQLVWKWVSADLETPVSTYLKLCNGEKYSFLLESVEGGATLGRYSAIGFDPDLIWQYDGNVAKEPLKELRQTLADSKIDLVDPSLPPMAASGLFGYMGYDCVRLIEDIPDDNPDALNIPESVMMRPTIMVIFDNVKNQMCIVTPVREKTGNVKEIYDKAVGRINDILQKLKDNVPEQNYETSLTIPLPVSSNMSEKEFHGMVDRAVDYINAGEIFQVVLAQRFAVDFDLPPFALYRSLRRLNPSPFLFFIQFDGFSLVGSSPEILVRLRKNTVTIRPIAGTRKRGQDEVEDKALAEDLLNDPKERAEHLMLLDLGRNDIGRVADINTVNVTDQFTIEYYSHVMHIVSNVEGRLQEDKDSIDALFAGFPAGTTSGAPKVRAMEIIDELEPTRRSFYAGCVGYLDANGDMDTCIALRTALVKDGKAYIQAGGGVVADSTPDGEYQESVNKARAVIAAAENAVEANK
jgi:anthranilate synthase component 1